MKTDLDKKVVLITGASGGIGSAIARQFAAEGATLVLHYRQGKATVAALQRKLTQTECVAVKADLTREGEVTRMFDQVLKRFKRVDTLIANAGSWETRDVPLHTMTLQQWRYTVDHVLTSAFLSVREFLKIVAKQRRGN